MKKVLVVDFDVEFLKSVSLMLREEGFEIITAVDGQAGLERFEADKPDLVILEAMLPRLHGFELCARITENQAHSAPVIVITGVYRDALYKTEALRTFGATAYFEKPVEMSRLMEAIRKALGAPAAPLPVPEPKKATAAGEKPPPLRPMAGVQVQAEAPPQVKSQPAPRPQPPPRIQAAPAVAPVAPAVAPAAPRMAPPPAQPAIKKNADQIEIDSLLKSALAELGLEPEETKTPAKTLVASPPSVQPPPRPVAPPPPPKPIQPPPRPAAAPLIPPAAKPVIPAAKPVPPPQPVAPTPLPPAPPVQPVAKPVPPPQPKPVAPTPLPSAPPVQPVAKPVPPPQPKPIAPTPSPFQPRVEPPVRPAPPPQPKPVAPPQPKPEPPPPPPPLQRPKPAIVAPPPPVAAPHPPPPPTPMPAPLPVVHPAPPPLRQPTPEKLPVFEKPAEPHAHAPAVPVMDMPEKRGHAPAFAEFIAEPKKKSSPVVFFAVAAVQGIAALGYFLVLKPKGREASPSVRQAQPPPVVTERPAVENASSIESASQAKTPTRALAGAAKPKPTPPPVVQPEPEPTTSALQAVIPAGEAKLEIQIPEQTAPQAAAKAATEQTETGAQGTVAPPAAANLAPAPPAKAQTGQLIPLEEADTVPRIVTRVEPVYPPIAFRMGIQGTVWINALVSETGNVLQAIFLRGTTAGGLDKAAETAVLKWKFQPAQKDGVNVKVWLPVRLDFVKRS